MLFVDSNGTLCKPSANRLAPDVARFDRGNLSVQGVTNYRFRTGAAKHHEQSVTRVAISLDDALLIDFAKLIWVDYRKKVNEYKK